MQTLSTKSIATCALFFFPLQKLTSRRVVLHIANAALYTVGHIWWRCPWPDWRCRWMLQRQGSPCLTYLPVAGSCLQEHWPHFGAWSPEERDQYGHGEHKITKSSLVIFRERRTARSCLHCAYTIGLPQPEDCKQLIFQYSFLRVWLM